MALMVMVRKVVVLVDDKSELRYVKARQVERGWALLICRLATALIDKR